MGDASMYRPEEPGARTTAMASGGEAQYIARTIRD